MTLDSLFSLDCFRACLDDTICQGSTEVWQSQLTGQLINERLSMSGSQ